MRNKIFFAAAVCLALIFGNSAVKCAEAAEIRPIDGFETIDFAAETKDGTRTLLRQERAELYCSAELKKMFPNLSSALDAIRDDESRKARMRYAEILESAREQAAESPEYFYSYSDSNKLFFNRADTVAVSVTDYSSSYYGGAHGMYGKAAMNFDTATGKRLNVSDVFADRQKLADAILEKILARHDREELFDPERKIAEIVADNSINWSLDFDGATFYFNPYHIAPYASGLITAKLYFDEDGALFREKYRRGPSAYAVECMFGEYETKRDGKIIAVEVSPEAAGLRVKFGAQELLVAGDFDDPHTMFVHRADGREFLYIDCLNKKRGVREITVCSLGKNIAQVGKLERTFFDPKGSQTERKRFWLTNPDGFSLYKNVTLPGEDPVDICSVNENGLLNFG